MRVRVRRSLSLQDLNTQSPACVDSRWQTDGRRSFGSRFLTADNLPGPFVIGGTLMRQNPKTHAVQAICHQLTSLS